MPMGKRWVIYHEYAVKRITMQQQVCLLLLFVLQLCEPQNVSGNDCIKK